MKKISYSVYKNAARMCVTFSYDDGKQNDIRLAELFEKYGLKATFNLNSSKLGGDKYITEADVKRLSDAGFEIAVHSLTHPFLESLSEQLIFGELYEDKKNLERITGKIVTGMAYPFGTFDERVKKIAASCGIKYSRTTVGGQRRIPKDFLEWGATCHHKNFDDYGIDNTHSNRMLYVWGHSYEFETESDWQKFENNLKRVARQSDIWYATNGEIYEYVTAQKNLIWNADFTLAYNPSAISVWVSVDNVPVEIPSGKTVEI